MTALSYLRKLIFEDYKKRYPNFPEHAIPINTFNNLKAEKRELKRITTFINLSDGVANITDSAAVRIDNRKMVGSLTGDGRMVGSVEYRKNHDMIKGTSDITATWKGQAWSIELKRIYKNGKDRQSQDQKIYQERVIKSGGKYVIVTSFQDFFEKFGNERD